MNPITVTDVHTRLCVDEGGTAFVVYQATGPGTARLPSWTNYHDNQEAQALRFWYARGATVLVHDESLQQDFQALLAADAAAR